MADAGKNGNGGRRQDSRRNDDACVFVGNVAFTTTWQRLKDAMRKVGDVQLVELIVDSSHKPKGSALVTFSSADEAKKACQMLNGTMIDNRELLVRPYEKGARPLVIYGNYTREQLARVMPKDKQDTPQQGPKAPPTNAMPGGDRVSLRTTARQEQGNAAAGGDEWRVFDGGDFNKRNRDTFGDEAVGYVSRGNGMPGQARGNIPAPASQQPDGGRRKLFVSNLPFSCTWKLLKDTFSQVGKVVRADIIMDDRGRSRGMGTVVFATAQEALRAIDEFDGIEMDGRAMGVRLDRDFTERA